MASFTLDVRYEKFTRGAHEMRLKRNIKNVDIKMVCMPEFRFNILMLEKY